MSKKSDQLGMNISTAQNRLRKDLLWHFVVKCEENTCFKCGEKITDKKDLSIEHKEPWLDAEDPLGLFFDLDNIAFSHLHCNNRRPAPKTGVPKKIRDHNRRKKRWKEMSVEERKADRRERYKRFGK